MDNSGPEAKSAEAIKLRLSECRFCCNYQDACENQCYPEEMIRANAAHYLPLLRKAQRPLPYSPTHGGDCMCIGCLIHKEIERLEKWSA